MSRVEFSCGHCGKMHPSYKPCDCSGSVRERLSAIVIMFVIVPLLAWLVLTLL